MIKINKYYCHLWALEFAPNFQNVLYEAKIQSVARATE